jgi:hypothetical protein
MVCVVKLTYDVENREQGTEIAVLFGPRGFRSETSFQKNRQRPPGLAVGNNTSTKFQALPARRVFHFRMFGIILNFRSPLIAAYAVAQGTTVSFSSLVLLLPTRIIIKLMHMTA